MGSLDGMRWIKTRNPREGSGFLGKPMVNKPLIRPYLWGGYVRGGWLTSHNNSTLILIPRIWPNEIIFSCLGYINGAKF